MSNTFTLLETRKPARWSLGSLFDYRGRTKYQKNLREWFVASLKQKKKLPGKKKLLPPVALTLTSLPKYDSPYPALPDLKLTPKQAFVFTGTKRWSDDVRCEHVVSALITECRRMNRWGGVELSTLEKAVKFYSGSLKISEAYLYWVLDRLSERGWISVTNLKCSDGRRRVYVLITPGLASFFLAHEVEMQVIEYVKA